MIFNPVIPSGGGGGFSGTATIKNSTIYDLQVRYMSQSMELEEQTISSSEVVIPIPQIVYIEGEGRNSSLSVNGDFTLIRYESYPQGRTIFVYGDVTATPN